MGFNISNVNELLFPIWTVHYYIWAHTWLSPIVWTTLNTIGSSFLRAQAHFWPTYRSWKWILLSFNSCFLLRLAPERFYRSISLMAHFRHVMGVTFPHTSEKLLNRCPSWIESTTYPAMLFIMYIWLIPSSNLENSQNQVIIFKTPLPMLVHLLFVILRP